MYLSSALALALVAGLTQAENFDVDVGQQGQTFDPRTVTAAEGDTVTFHFYNMHNVIQGPFQQPCTPSDNGFFSGTIQAPQGREADQRFVVTVNNTDPLWFYCNVGRHCQNGMVGVINPPQQGNNIEGYANGARGVAQSRAPDAPRGGVFRAEGGDDLDNNTMSIMPVPSGTSTPGASGSAGGASGTPTGSGSAASATSSALAGSTFNGQQTLGTGLFVAAVGVMARYLL